MHLCICAKGKPAEYAHRADTKCTLWLHVVIVLCYCRETCRFFFVFIIITIPFQM